MEARRTNATGLTNNRRFKLVAPPIDYPHKRRRERIEVRPPELAPYYKLLYRNHPKDLADLTGGGARD